jgi:hypothetical protein
MIPKRMIFYWDKKYMSWMRYMTLKSFRDMNPDWEMVLCMGDDQLWDTPLQDASDFKDYKGDNYYTRISELDITIEQANMSDIFPDGIKTDVPTQYSDLYRYYKIYKEGGFYVDMDVLFFRPMDELYKKVALSDSNTVICACDKYAAIGFLGGEKGNRFFKALLDLAISNKDYTSRFVYGDMLLTKFLDIVGLSTALVPQKIEQKFEELKVYNVLPSLLYHYDFYDVNKVYCNAWGIDTFAPDSIGYHWYGGDETSQKYNNILTENNYKQHNTVFGTIYRELYENI